MGSGKEKAFSHVTKTGGVGGENLGGRGMRTSSGSGKTRKIGVNAEA